MTNYDSDYEVRLAELQALGGDVTKKFDSVYEIDLAILSRIQGGAISESVINDSSVALNTTFSSSKIMQLVADAGFKTEFVEHLPATGDVHTLYFVPSSGAQSGNTYDEFMWNASASEWEQVGSTAIDTSNYYTKSEVDELIDTISNTANSDIEGKETIDFTFVNELPVSGEEGQYVIIHGENQDALYEYTSGEWVLTTPDATKLYFNTETEALYSYVSADSQFAPVSLVNSIIVGSNLNNNAALKSLKTPGVYNVVQRLHNATKGDYIKNWTLTVESVDYEEYDKSDSIYQRLVNNYTIQKRTWSATRASNDGWSSFSTYYAGEIKDSTTSKYYTWSSNKLNASLGAKQDVLTAGQNISIDASNNIFAEGYIFDASKGSFAEQYFDDDNNVIATNTATGIGSHAEGWGTYATGDWGSHTEGYGNTASGECSHAEGYSNTASGNYGSHAEGYGNTASSDCAHAEGGNNTASSYYTHAEGQHNTASGNTSHAEGAYNTASGTTSHAEGWNTIAQNQTEHAEGQTNLSHKASDTYGNAGNTQHSVGIGVTPNRKNAFEVMQNGDAYMFGLGGYVGTDTKVQNASIKTLQEVVNSKQDTLTAGDNISIDASNRISANVPQLAAGENISIEDGKINAVGYKAGMSVTDSFVELPEHLFEPYIDMTSQLPSTDLNFTGAAGTTTYTVSGVLTSMLSQMVGAAALQVGNGPIALLTAYDSTNNIVTLDKSLSDDALNNTPMSKFYIVVSITLSGAANTTTYTYIDTMGMVQDIFKVGAKIKIDDYPITKVIALDSDNNTVTFEVTLDSENAVSNAEFKYAFVPNNIASGVCAHAEGGETTASGLAAHTEGSGTIASGGQSHAEGYRTTASSDGSHAEGNYNQALAEGAHAEGGETSAVYKNVASAKASHAEGGGVVASGIRSHAEGSYTYTQNRAEHAEGQNNRSHKANTTWGNAGNTIHSVGIGSNQTEQSRGNGTNALEIMQNGDMYVLGVGNYQGTDITTAQNTIKTLQVYLASLEARITALENASTGNNA